jgi:hypothetical protein
MYAFGDLLLFAGVFGTLGLLPTGLGLVFLRPYRLVWSVLSAAGVVVAASGVTALAVFTIGRGAAAPSSLGMWAALAVLRILPAPLIAAGFLLAGVVAPHRGPRWTLLAASGVELAVCVSVGLVWLSSLHLH